MSGGFFFSKCAHREVDAKAASALVPFLPLITLLSNYHKEKNDCAPLFSQFAAMIPASCLSTQWPNRRAYILAAAQANVVVVGGGVAVNEFAYGYRNLCNATNFDYRFTVG